jgi:hypothetical protein
MLVFGNIWCLFSFLRVKVNNAFESDLLAFKDAVEFATRVSQRHAGGFDFESDCPT